MNLERANDFLMEAVFLLVEKVNCDRDCMNRYKNTKTGRFKGKSGERFDNCVKAFQKCCKGVTDAEAICAKIARSKGLAPGQSGYKGKKPGR